ncbi:MAG TPA: LytTR family DNA-binding domain-containing protein [Cyclobacteriaceae bacterium]|jgi:DNA-binding LytR/AlgR family response regulator|nr:LytTR family DNA-binding domain-containing protein [Cyclobacteriaceae bacterium]
MKLKCLVVDDEAPARKLISDYVSKVNWLELTGSCESGLEAREFLRQKHIDILLLDIQMPDMTGIELLKDLDQKPLTIFVTAYQEYALKGFELDVIDYLLKPVSFDRFKKAIDKSVEYIGFQNGQLTKAEVRDYFFLKTDTRIVKIMFSEVSVVEAQREYVKIVTPTKKVMSLMSMNKIAELLPADFIRIHRSYVVNLRHIDEVQGNLVQIGTEFYPIGKNFRDAFFLKLDEMKF